MIRGSDITFEPTEKQYQKIASWVKAQIFNIFSIIFVSIMIIYCGVTDAQLPIVLMIFVFSLAAGIVEARRAFHAIFVPYFMGDCISITTKLEAAAFYRWIPIVRLYRIRLNEKRYLVIGVAAPILKKNHQKGKGLNYYCYGKYAMPDLEKYRKLYDINWNDEK